MGITPSPGPAHGPDPGPLPDADLHELTVRVNNLEVASRIYRANIQHLQERVDHLEKLLAGGVPGDVRVDGIVTVKDVVLT